MTAFSEALEHLKSNGFVKRDVIKNDTVVVNHKNRLYQMSLNTGVRYPYAPTDEDLLAEDWLLLSNRDTRQLKQMILTKVK